MKLKTLAGTLAVAGMLVPGVAMATNGYFSHGYGITAKGMGGASTAMAKDAMGGANNPASMAFVGNSMNIGVDWFSPKRSMSRTNSTGGANNGSVASDSNDFLVPELGFNMMLNDRMSLGLTVYGNGGMNTNYAGGQLSTASCGFPGGVAASTQNILCGSGRLGMTLEQLIVAPTFAFKVNPSNSIGVSPLFVYQRFAAQGLDGFGALSSDSTKLTNKGYDTSTGWGVRLGWQGKITDAVTLGATFSPKIDMSKFKNYAGLFAEQGDFDIPMNWNLGVAFNATPALTLALDYQHIGYSGVKSINNSGITAIPPIGGGPCPTTTANPSLCLGGSNGVGFGWSDVNIWKLGAEYKLNDALTIRAGYNKGSNPVKSGEQTFNIIAPGVVTDHYTLGATYAVTKGSEVTVSYMHAQEKSVSGSTNQNFPVGGTETIKMHQNALGIAYGMKF